MFFRNGRRYKNTVAQHDDVFCRTLRDVAALVENNRFVESGKLCIGFCKSRIDICTDHFAASGNNIVVHAAPGGNCHMRPRAVDIADERHDGNRHPGRQVMKADTDDFVSVKRKRANKNGFLISLLTNEIDGELRENLFCYRKLHAEQFAGFQKSLVMIERTKHKHLFFFFIPVSADAAEDPGSVI